MWVVVGIMSTNDGAMDADIGRDGMSLNTVRREQVSVVFSKKEEAVTLCEWPVRE
jgi:hypothetical protein